MANAWLSSSIFDGRTTSKPMVSALMTLDSHGVLFATLRRFPRLESKGQTADDGPNPCLKSTADEPELQGALVHDARSVGPIHRVQELDDLRLDHQRVQPLGAIRPAGRIWVLQLQHKLRAIRRHGHTIQPRRQVRLELGLAHQSRQAGRAFVLPAFSFPPFFLQWRICNRLTYMSWPNDIFCCESDSCCGNVLSVSKPVHSSPHVSKLFSGPIRMICRTKASHAGT